MSSSEETVAFDLTSDNRLKNGNDESLMPLSDPAVAFIKDLAQLGQIK